MVAHATLDTEQLLSHTRTALVDTVNFLQGSDDGLVAASKMYELLTNIYDILNNAVSKWACNMADVLAYLFNSASRQHHEVWASWFPFLHSIMDSVPPSEACLYRCIN